LRESGFEFERHKTDGIPHKIFAEYLISSGLVLNERNHWITFHGSVDFGYLLKLLMGQNLPNLQDDFLNALDTYFINFYDCKEVKREIDLQGGLVKVAKELDVDRIGTMH
jgi:CCR4-NOT transcription complex subunit 7/8